MPDLVQQKLTELQDIMSEGISLAGNLITVEEAMRDWAQMQLPGFTVDKIEFRDGVAYISMSGGE